MINQQLRHHLVRFGQTVRLCIALLAGLWRSPELGRRLRQVAGLQITAAGALFVLLVASPFGPGMPDAETKLGGELILLLLVSHMVVLALSFEFHDDLTRRASLWLGVRPEDPDQTPRFRFNLQWVRKRIRRQWRGWLIMTVGVALLAPLSMFHSVIHVSATSLWSLHWFGVFALGKSAVAWKEPIHRAPWLIRMRDACDTHAWMYALPPVWIAHALNGPLHNLWAPVVNAEDHPGEALGLAGLHALSNVPLLGFLLRPWVPLCSAMLLEEGPQAALERVHDVSMGLSPRTWEETVPPDVTEAIVEARPTDAGSVHDTPKQVPRFTAAVHDTPVEVPRFVDARHAPEGSAGSGDVPPQGLPRRR